MYIVFLIVSSSLSGVLLSRFIMPSYMKCVYRLKSIPYTHKAYFDYLSGNSEPETKLIPIGHFIMGLLLSIVSMVTILYLKF